jgi:hypothetical protein
MCSASWSIKADATASTDLQCAECNDGEFTASAGLRTAQTTCGKGELISADSKVAQRTCSACADGKYQHLIGRHTACHTHPMCGVGQWMAKNLKTERRHCSQCNGSTQYQDKTSHTETSCVAQPTCGKGELISASSAVAARTCSACADGTYQHLIGRHTSCSPYAGACANGALIVQASRTSKDHCGKCDSGYELVGKDCSPFAGVCANGALADQADRTSDHHCGSCDSGYYAVGKACSPFAECNDGKFTATLVGFAVVVSWVKNTRKAVPFVRSGGLLLVMLAVARPVECMMPSAVVPSAALLECLSLGPSGVQLPRSTAGAVRRASVTPLADVFRARTGQLKDTFVGRFLFGAPGIEMLGSRRTVLRLKLRTPGYALSRIVVPYGYAQLIFLIAIYIPWALTFGNADEQAEARALVQFILDLSDEVGACFEARRGNRVLEEIYQLMRAHRFHFETAKELAASLEIAGCFFRMAEVKQQLELRSGASGGPRAAWRVGSDFHFRHEIEVLHALQQCRLGIPPQNSLLVCGMLPHAAGSELRVDLSQDFRQNMTAVYKYAEQTICDVAEVKTISQLPHLAGAFGSGMAKMAAVFEARSTEVISGIRFRAHFIGFRLDLVRLS